jgi:putative hydrolase of the HAD superfamily
MIIRGIIFDINGTLIDIHTDEGSEDIYRAISHYLSYQGIYLHRWEVRDKYYEIIDKQRQDSAQEHFEFDAVEAWREFMKLNATGSTLLTPEKLKQIPLFLAETYRGISRHRLQLYPGVKAVLEELHGRFRLAALSDAQSAWALPEMQAVGIESFFDPIIISSDYGFRKPDRRLFEAVLSAIEIEPENVLFVGNDMYRDIFGARQLGIKTVFFPSNQGKQQMNGVNPDYIIYRFTELKQAISFFESQ